MTKAQELINLIEELDGEYPPYRNKFGELCSKKDAVLFYAKNGNVYRMSKGKKGKKVNMDNFGRAAREKGQNRRAYDGAKLPR